MQKLDTIANEEGDYRVSHEGSPLVRHNALRNTKAGDNVAENKITNRGRRGNLERLGFNPLGKEIGGHNDELVLLRGMGMDDAYQVYSPSATWPWLDNWLQRNVGNVLHWSVSLAILTPLGESNTVIENCRPIVAVATD